MNNHTATCQLMGRVGNIAYQLMHLIAYATKYGYDYYIPTNAPHQPDKRNPFNIESTGKNKHDYKYIREITPAYYQELQDYKKDICFSGYWQSFKYVDDYREQILKAFNLPVAHVNAVSLHVRRGDYLKLKEFEVMPIDYYRKCIQYFQSIGHNVFYVFSDDIGWCKDNFNAEDYGCRFVFIEGGTEISDLIHMKSCVHNICANSSFSFIAAWFNMNPDKIVLCPDEFYCWFNKDYIPDYYKIMKV